MLTFEEQGWWYWRIRDIGNNEYTITYLASLQIESFRTVVTSRTNFFTWWSATSVALTYHPGPSLFLISLLFRCVDLVHFVMYLSFTSKTPSLTFPPWRMSISAMRMRPWRWEASLRTNSCDSIKVDAVWREYLMMESSFLHFKMRECWAYFYSSSPVMTFKGYQEGQWDMLIHCETMGRKSLTGEWKRN